MAAAVEAYLAELSAKSVLKYRASEAAGTAAVEISRMFVSSGFPKTLDDSIVRTKEEADEILQLNKQMAKTFSELTAKMSSLQKETTAMEQTLITEQSIDHVGAARNKVNKLLVDISNSVNDRDKSTFQATLLEIDASPSVPELLRNMHLALFDEKFTVEKPLLPYLLNTLSSKLEDPKVVDYGVFEFLNDVDRWLHMLEYIEWLGSTLIIVHIRQRVETKTELDIESAIKLTLETSEQRIRSWSQVLEYYIAGRPAFSVIVEDGLRQLGQGTPKLGPTMRVLRTDHEQEFSHRDTTDGNALQPNARYHRLVGKARIRNSPMQLWTFQLADGNTWEIWGHQHEKPITVQNINQNNLTFNQAGHNPPCVILMSHIGPTLFLTVFDSLRFKIIPLVPTGDTHSPLRSEWDSVWDWKDLPKDSDRVLPVALVPVSTAEICRCVALDSLHPPGWNGPSESAIRKRWSGGSLCSGMVTVRVDGKGLYALVPQPQQTRNEDGDVEAELYIAQKYRPYYVGCSQRSENTQGIVFSAVFAVWKVHEFQWVTTLTNRDRALDAAAAYVDYNYNITDPTRIEHISNLLVTLSVDRPKGNNGIRVVELPKDQVTNVAAVQASTLEISGGGKHDWQGEVALQGNISLKTGADRPHEAATTGILTEIEITIRGKDE